MEEQKPKDQVSQSLPPAASSNSCEKDPCERELATLDPPPQYYKSFHTAWLEKIGEGVFEIDRECLYQRRNSDGFCYFCLWVKPTNFQFPVQNPHLSLGKYKFIGHNANWRASIQCQSYLWKREVQGQFAALGKGTNFQLLEGNELYALQELLKETLAKESVEQLETDRQPHISWTELAG